ncbi:MAG: LysR family cys regulon transcriptional activator [Gammaproteobacteria bacterium]|jgi:LysR family cys regulon transcriptional activator
MKLQQLKYIWEVARHDLNVTATAESLYTSQPGVSKQIRLLEEELGVLVFRRNGKHLTEITPAGQAILNLVGDILDNIGNVKKIAEEYADNSRGSLSIATTHTQARYVLPKIIEKFIGQYPAVTLNMHQGTPVQISEIASKGTADFAIATEALELFNNLVMMPCYQWNRSVIVPRSHPLTSVKSLTLEELVKYPIVTYVFGFTGRSQLDKAFNTAGLNPKVVFTASDADVIKTYVNLGLGIGIIASMAYDAINDSELSALDASHLFESSTTKIGFRRGSYIRGYMYDFIQMFAPHLDKNLIDEAAATADNQALNALFSGMNIPSY